MASTRFGLLATSALALVSSVSALPSGLTRRDPAAYTFSGCYVDNSDGHRALSASSYAADDMTVASCAAFCSSFKYFGLEYARECYCDNSISPAATAADLSDCSYPCAGDASATCGAGNRLSVYQNTAPVAGPAPATLDGIPYVGCFHEGPQRVLPFKGVSAPDMTAAKCAANCEGYTYFGTEYGSECYCGNDLPTIAAPASECSMTCSGDATQLCGAGDRLTVYGPVGVAPATLPPVGAYAYEGCYTDGPGRVLSGKASYDDNMTLEMCAAACASYPWFGVEYSKECYCGTELPSSSVKKPQSDCTMTCAGNHDQICGDGNRLSVYHNAAATGGSAPAPVGGFQYKSCWTDDVYDRSLKGDHYAADDMTVESCAAFCSQYTYFGVEYSRECYCGDTVLGSAAAESDCSHLCSGNNAEWCGGPSRLNLYQKQPPPEPSSDGCPGTAPANAVLVNGAFECGATLDPWVVGSNVGGTIMINPGTPGAWLPESVLAGDSTKFLHVFSNYYQQNRQTNINIYQILNTVPGKQYQLSFDLDVEGGGGNNWNVAVGSNPAFASGTHGFPWTTFSTTFTAVGSDKLSLNFNSVVWAYAHFYFDNFVIKEVATQ
ncbi:hypothetical protein NEMBOFW57_006513 [Staphylotrichum longicolle]|uniref:WSC domain-containing protein n=1 Tax=Staphylotrichum longicolle TaxID=669026 RepID=A0AAD4HZN1_9PEZI|nr:hypothetical protein NEMBOFW57_006513 [Staphylotrichum longicolle]